MINHKALILAGIAALFMTPAHATFVVDTGALGTGDNVIVQNCTGNILGPASMVQGCLNGSHTTLVDVSTTSGSLTANGGQARFDATGGNIGDFKINFDDSSLSFTGIVLNIDTLNGTSSTATFTISAVDALGNIEAAQVFSGFALDGNGNNFFNLTSTDGEVALYLRVDSSQGNIVSVEQIRIDKADIPECSGANCGPPPGVPEPGTLWLLGAGLLGLGAFGRLRRQRAI